jgi:hypothetical protein
MAAITSPHFTAKTPGREAQAGRVRRIYDAPQMADGTMNYWLRVVLKEARERADRKMVHVAASADRDQSTIYRFETQGGWPTDTDLYVAAYADDLGLSPLDLWGEALQRWRENGTVETVAEIQRRKDSPGEEFERALEGDGPARAPTRAANAGTSRATRRRRASG